MYNSIEMYIIPKKYDAAKIRLEIKKQMAKEGKEAVLIPELGTLYDVALEKSGIGLGKGLGKVIMKEDFFCLLDQIDELPDKFKNSNRNYKSAIFALLNEMSFASEELDSYPFHGTVHAAGLTREHCTLIYKTVRERGFLFRAEVYRKAIEELDKKGLREEEEYILYPGEYYTHLEQQLLEKLGASPADADDGNQVLCTAMFSDDTTGDFQISEPEKMVGFLKADSIMEQYIAVKDHILATMKNDPSLRLDDFCLVLGGDDSLSLCTSYYESIGFHPVSSASVQAETPLLDGLNLIFYALSGDIEKLILYFNRHNPDSKVTYDPTYDFGDFWNFSKKLAKSDGSRFDRFRDVPPAFKEWIQKFSGLDNRKQSASKHLRQLQIHLKKLDAEGESLYEYEPSLRQIFKSGKGEDIDISLKDLVEYFKNILAGRKRNLISTWDDGIVLVKMGEYIPKCRHLYFADLEEKTFLKDKMPNLLLSSEEHDNFNTEVYGCTKEEHLKKCFAQSVARSQRILFVIPSYDEGTVVSEYVENALRLFPVENRPVKVVWGNVPEFRHPFFRTFRNTVWENAAPELAPASSEDFFKPHVKEGDPLEYVLGKLSSATRIEPFMRCPARFIYDCQAPGTQLKDEIHFTRGNAFHMFCEMFFSKQNIKVFAMNNPDLVQEVALYLSNLPCDPELAAYMDSLDVRGMFKTVCDKYSDLKLKDTDLHTYLSFICRCMKDLMGDCDSSSIRLEVFIGGAPLLSDPPVAVGEGYIDMMFCTTNGEVVLVDFKSTDIKEFPEDVNSISNVQLLIYSHIVEEALKNRDFSVFQPTDEQRGRMKEKGKDESSILNPGYFDSIEADAPVSAFYLSYKGNDNYRAVSGISSLEDPYGRFENKLKDLLGQAARNEFKPSYNKDCIFCPINSFCPDRENGMSMDALYQRLNLKGPFFNQYPVPKELTSAASGPSSPADDPVRIIQFAERAKYSAVADTSSDIIISAGAGAGKTEVLTTRYLNLLLSTDAELENILCITFTEKAAGEMKKRIFAKLRDTLSLGAFYSLPADGQGQEAYKLTPAQIQKLQKARKNFFRKNRISTFHSFCLNMLTRYEKENPASQRDLTSAVVEDFVIRDKKIAIISSLINTFAESDEAFARWALYLPLYFRTDNGEGGVALDILNLLNSMKLSGMPLTEESKDYLAHQFKERKQAAINELWDKFEILRDNLLEALEQLRSEETKPGNIKKLDAEIEEVTRGSCGDAGRYPYKTNPMLKSLLKAYQSIPCPSAEECCTLAEEQNLHSILFEILLVADRMIEQYKIENSIIELSDYHLNLISLLENKKILKKIKDELKYIMVDEFQDTNWLQKKILDSLHDENNHLFVVGDLKQSIYRFQQCDNQIFKQYRDQDSMLYITFQDNFRSVKQIVDFNNRYFSENLVQEYRIIPNTSKNPEKPEFSIPRRPEATWPVVNVVGFGYLNDDFKELATREKNALVREQEAFFIARTIAATGKENYGKWGILVREYTNMNFILDALQRLNIPYSFCIKKDFFRQSEIVQVLLVLQVLYGFLPQEILAANPVLSEFVSGYDQKEKGFCYAVSSIMKLPMYAPVRPMLHQLLLQCRDFVRQLGECPEDIIVQLLKFADENSKEINVSALENGVRIMTVHSSKGLEFDYLFVSKITDYTGKGGFGGPRSSIDFINYVDEYNNQIIDYDITGFRKLVKDERPLLYDAWIKDKNTEFESEEKGNLLYVAFTRAKKHLVVTMQSGKLTEDGLADVQPDVNWFKNIVGNLPYYPEIVQNPEFDISLIEPVLNKDKPALMYPVEQKEFPAPELATVSVSRHLDAMEEEYDLDDKITDADDEAPEAAGSKASEVGTAVHSFFEKNVGNLSSAKPEDFPVPESIRSRFLAFAKAGLAVPEYHALVSDAEKLIPEKAMIFRTPEGKLLNGVIDLIVKKGNSVTVLDYKTHSGSSLDDNTLERYKKQVALYAHGLKSIFPGCTFDCCLLVMYSTGKSELVWC